jgi:hypothetical protein
MAPWSASSVPRFARLSGVWDMSCSVLSLLDHSHPCPLAVAAVPPRARCLRRWLSFAARVFRAERRTAVNNEPSIASDLTGGSDGAHAIYATAAV